MTLPPIVENPRGLSEAAKKKGYQIRRRVIGHAYSRNGNAHNPTERVTFEAYDAKGKLVASSARMAYAVAVANDHAVDPE